MSIIQTVKSSPLFYELYDDEISSIVDKCRVLSLGAGEYVFEVGDTGDDIFLLLHGSAQVLVNDIEIAKLRKGDLFGEMALLRDPLRHADIYVDHEASLLVLNADDIFRLFESNNKLFSIIMLNLSRMLATRLKDAGGKIRSLSIENHELKSQIITKKSA